MMTYSIIIPVYNAEKYLSECVDSVLQQQGCENWEIILVDDGSPDDSGAICDAYALKDPRVRVIHKENGGVSSARNAGLDAARGDYVLFLDSDDLWQPDLLTTLTPALEGAPDVVQFGYEEFSEAGVRPSAFSACLPQDEGGEDYLRRLFRQDQTPIAAVWAASYRREFLENHALRFETGVIYGEDFYFQMQAVSRAERIVGVDRALYRYRKHPGAVTGSISGEKLHSNLSVLSRLYRQFPCAAFANAFCYASLGLGRLKEKEERRDIVTLLEENKDIFQNVSGRKMKTLRCVYRALGHAGGADLICALIKRKNRIRRGD